MANGRRTMVVGRIGLVLLSLALVVAIPIDVGEVGIGPFLYLMAFLAVVVAPVVLSIAVFGLLLARKSLFTFATPRTHYERLLTSHIIGYTMRSSWVAALVLIVIETINMFGVLGSGPPGPVGRAMQSILTAILYSTLTTLFWWMPLSAKKSKAGLSTGDHAENN